jgi:hypothetical protein
MYKKCAWLPLGLVIVFPAVMGSAVVNSNVSGVALTSTLLEALTVIAAPGVVNFSLNSGGSATGSTPVAVTTTWVFAAGRTAVNVYGSFASATAALTDGSSNDIPSSNVLGQVTTGSPTSYTAFTQTGPFGAAGGSLQLLSQAISVANVTGTRTDNLTLKIDLTSTPQLPAGVYTGTLNIQAQAP